MLLTSPAFDMGKPIPREYTCQGEDKNPPLTIQDVPEGAKSLVLIMDDPDVPSWVRTDNLWVHWVVYNIDPSTKHIDENTKSLGVLGRNTADKEQYMGPCPPDRQHRYFFKLYALDIVLDLGTGSTKDQVLSAIEGHVIAYTELVGTYVKT